jgi:hypothetical protein
MAKRRLEALGGGLLEVPENSVHAGRVDPVPERDLVRLSPSQLVGDDPGAIFLAEVG